MVNAQNRHRKKKHKFGNNQHTFKKKRKLNDSEPVPATPNGLRSQKLSSTDGSVLEKENYFVFIDFDILKTFIEAVAVCNRKDCGSKNVVFLNKLNLRMGLACKLQLLCNDCSHEVTFFTSEECRKSEPIKTNNDNKGRNLFECNVRTVAAFREIGKGHESIINFSRCMNVHSISEWTYRNINKDLHDAYQKVAVESMGHAADTALKKCRDDGDVIQREDRQLGLCRVSLDGTWQKRGHASLNGVVTACHDGKCVDVYVMSKHCSVCQLKRQSLQPLEFEDWYKTHDCKINHIKSSGAMEGVGAVEIFSRSTKRDLIYHEYLGDGDTSSYKEVVASNPYGNFDIVPTKLECIGHVQKRLGTRLRNKVKELKGTSTPISGKGKLTELVINSLQNFYGRAIRENTNQLY
ncbi:uncharacterized protein LOC130635880 [Hydractinia symbiolongicarpus]|uniref:uncharacterized protein LOC130635880 n=1 Tax=Hydractinia symbiolongicarpus TaxID=13093 RepID=UPI00254F75C1|nr:uncharacterized protein LOC130635880 [Hydractinia symbiolongicarpus]